MSRAPVDTCSPELVQYDFCFARRGKRSAHCWTGRHIVIMLETRDGKRASISASDITRTSLVRALDLVYLTFVSLTGMVPDARPYSRGGKLVVQVPLDNAGAGGLACHGVAGISVGVSIFSDLMKRWERACVSGIDWLPRPPASVNELDVHSCSSRLRLSDGRPEDASIDHVFLYELNRNFWPPWFNRKIDWACNGDPACWGWWTVGMNNAMAIIIPTLLNLPFFYFGNSLRRFRDGMVGQLQAYTTYIAQSKELRYPFDAWTSSLLPWDRKNSVNDLMTGLIVRSFECFGRERWIARLFRGFSQMPDINDSNAGGTNFQGARNNVYRLWSYAANADLLHVFERELRWEISNSVRGEVAAMFPARHATTNTGDIITPSLSLNI